MKLSEARQVRTGQYIASPLANPAWRVRRVTETWHNTDSSVVRFKCAGYSQQDWLPPDAFVKCPTFRIPPMGETKGERYRLGDILRPEHRPSQADHAS